MFKYEQVSNLPMKTHRDQCLLSKKEDKRGLINQAQTEENMGAWPPNPQPAHPHCFLPWTVKRRKRTLATAPREK